MVRMEGEAFLHRHLQQRITLLCHYGFPHRACPRWPAGARGPIHMDSTRLLQSAPPLDRVSRRPLLAFRGHSLAVRFHNLLRNSLPGVRPMTADHASMSHHPAPHRDQVSVFESAFGLLGGPAAWFAQLCAGYAMASWPCFPREEHPILPQASYAWTSGAIVVMSLAAIALSIAALFVARRVYERVQDENLGC